MAAHPIYYPFMKFLASFFSKKLRFSHLKFFIQNAMRKLGIHQRLAVEAGVDLHFMPFSAGLCEALHDLEDMEGLIRVCTERTPGLERLRHIGKTESAAVVRVIERERDVLHALARLEELDRTAEAVRVGYVERSLGAVHFKTRLARIMHIERGVQCADRAVYEAHIARVQRRDVHLDDLSVVRLTGDEPLRERRPRHCGNRLHVAAEIDQRSQIVRTHVEHRAAAVLVVEFRIRMPCLVAVADHEARAAHDVTDHTVIDQFAAGLDARAEERVRRAADPEPLFLRQRHDLLAFFERSGEGLFRIDVLARVQRRHRHVVVLVGAGDVQDNVDLRVGEELVHILVELRNVVVLHRIFRALRDQVAHADDLNFLEALRDVFEINAGNRAASDKTDLYFAHS